MIAGACLSIFGGFFFWRFLIPQLRISMASCNLAALQEMLSMGGWVSVSTVGTILFLGVDLLVVNRMFGPDACGQYAAVLQWSTLLRTFATTIAGVFGPTILFYYAQQDRDGLVLYSRRAVKFVGLLIGIPTAIISGFSAPLLRIWLGPSFVALAPLMVVLTAPLAVNLAYLPLHSICMATNKVRIPGLVQLAAGAANLALAILLASLPSLGMYGVAIAGAVVLCLRNIVFTPIYAAHILGIRWSSFLYECISISTATCLLSVACWSSTLLCTINSWAILLLFSIVLVIGHFLIIYILFLSTDERNLLRGIFFSIFLRIKTVYSHAKNVT
jgi:membrane protein EpsK